MKILIYGSQGWIGQQICDYVSKYMKHIEIIHGVSRVDNEEDVEQEILNVKPDRILSLIGRTHGAGYNTIDYLEQKGKIVENIRDNLYAPLVLALCAKKHGIHYTYLGTGCIFNGYPELGYRESDKPDFFGSSYSVVKGYTDRIMHLLNDTVLNIRIRMPINAQINKRNFITKIMTYKKICSIPNSMTVLPEMIPILMDLMIKAHVGTINLTNPGLISHNEILMMAREILNKDLEWENITLEQQNELLLSQRSNNYLCTELITTMYPNITNIKDSVRNILCEMKTKYKRLTNF